MAHGDFCFALINALILMSHALRFQTQPGTVRLLPKAATAGEWIPLGPLVSMLRIETRKGKEG
jgi:hypothetical protein